MKLFKIAVFTFTFSVLLFSTNVHAYGEIENNLNIELEDGVLGSWDYHVPGVDPAYQNGIMHITEADGGYVVNLELPGGTIPTEDVEVNEGEVRFALYVEGQRVEVTVVIEGDALTGSGTTDEGPFTLTGTRKS